MKGFVLLFLATSFLTAQKVVKKSLINATISTIQIDVTNCFEMNIETSDSDAIIVTATIDGEYKKDLLLSVKEEGTTFQVSAGFQPSFTNPNDKLSAHKVVSIALDIQLPKGKNVNVSGLSCNVTVKGEYQKIKVTLNDGASSLHDVSGVVDVISQSGNIFANTNAAEIVSASKYGTIVSAIIPKGNNKYSLSTVTGNIHISKIE